MKKISLLAMLSAFFILFPLQAEQVSQEMAGKVAENYLKKGRMQLRSSKTLTLTPVHTATSGMSLRTSVNQPAVYYYVFNINDGDGFIIISGDDIAVPVLGYSLTGKYIPGNYPPEFRYWMEGFEQQIADGIQAGVHPDEQTREQWSAYLNGTPLLEDANVVEPLLKTLWDQSAPYNNLCPMKSGKRSVTGCVATAMAQIMKYYNHPAKGTGSSKAYTTDGLNVPAVNFEVNYGWDQMKDTYERVNPQDPGDAVATLMYHCGVSVEMKYDPGTSATQSSKVATALPLHFSYDKSIVSKPRKYYKDDEWHAMLKKELDANRPVYYSGSSGESGHAFVCDGYDSGNRFHMNWGWGGIFNGYFATNALNPGTGGAGSGSGTYNQSQRAIIQIMPDQGGQPTPEIRFRSSQFLTSSSTSVDRGEGFVVTLPVRNLGNGEFKGTLGVATVDANGKIVEVIGELSGTITIPPDSYTSGLQPTVNCLFSSAFTPDDYHIKAVSKREGGQWEVVSGGVGSTEMLTITLTSGIRAHSLKLTRITGLVTSKTSVARGENFQLTFSAQNVSPENFDGDLAIAVCDAADQIIQIAGSRTTSISSGSSQNVTEINGAFAGEITPGNYKVRIVAKPTDQPDYSIVWGIDGNTRTELTLAVTSQTVTDESKLSVGLPAGIEVKTTTLKKGEPITLSAGLMNTGTGDFNGEIEAGIYDTTGELLQLLEKKVLYLKKSEGSMTSQTFSFANPKLEVSGSHKLTIYYKHFTGTRKKADDFLTFTNEIDITIDKDEGDLYLEDPGITVKSGVLKRGEAVTFEVGLKNQGDSDFTGEMEAAIYSLTGELIQLIEKKNVTITGAATGTAEFTTSELEVVGNYKLRVYFTPPNAEKKLVGDGPSHQNDIDIAITPGDPDLIVWAPGITVTGGTLEKGESATFTAGLKNQGYGDFEGEIEAGIYTPEGILVQEIGKKTINLASGDTILGNFTVNKLEAAGDYKLQIYFTDTINGRKLAGSTPPYPNDVDVTIIVDNGELYISNPGIILTAGTLKKGESVTYTAGLKNLGSGDFKGEVEARIYSTSQQLIQVLDKKDLAITSGDTLLVEFSTSKLEMNGDYKIRIYFTPTGGQVKLADDLPPFMNDLAVTIADEDDPTEGLIIVAPGINILYGELKKNHSVTFAVGLENIGNVDFDNEIGVELYALTGEFIQLIGKRDVQIYIKDQIMSPFYVSNLDIIGDYKVRIYYLNQLGEKKMVADSQYFSNDIDITIEDNPDPVPMEGISLADTIIVKSETLKKGEPATIAFELKNISSTDFNGEIGIEICSTDDMVVYQTVKDTVNITSGNSIVKQLETSPLEVSGPCRLRMYFISAGGTKEIVSNADDIYITIEEEAPPVEPGEGLSMAAPGIQVSPNPLKQGYSISVTTGLQNIGDSDFEGEIEASLYTKSGQLAQLIERKAIQIPKGSTVSVEFFNQKLEVAGDHTLRLYYTPAGGETKIVESNSSYQNDIELKIEEDKPVIPREGLSMAAPGIQVSPDPLKQDYSISITTGLQNIGDSDFKGEIEASLYTKSGQLAQLIERKAIQIPKGSTVSVEFFNQKLEVAGDHTLRLYYTPAGGETKIVESNSSYPNDIELRIEEDKPVSNDQIRNAKLSFFPNPVRTILHITGIPHSARAIRIYDTSGQLQKVISLSEEDREVSISLASLAAGVYFISLETTRGEYKTKIMKK